MSKYPLFFVNVCMCVRACVCKCVRAVCFVFKYFCFLGSFFVLFFMPLTSKKLRGHIGLGLSMRLSVCLSVVRMSICLSAHPQFGRQKDRQLHRQRGKAIVQHWLVRVRKLQGFIFFLSFCACMQSVRLSVCLPACLNVYTHNRTYACTRTYLPTNRQTERKK